MSQQLRKERPHAFATPQQLDWASTSIKYWAVGANAHQIRLLAKRDAWWQGARGCHVGLRQGVRDCSMVAMQLGQGAHCLKPTAQCPPGHAKSYARLQTRQELMRLLHTLWIADSDASQASLAG